MQELTYAFIGAGNMSGAVLAGMIKSGVKAEHIIATNRSTDKQTALNERYGVHTHLTNLEAIEKADVVILGVKPQMMLALLTDLVVQGANFKDKLVLTVAAGLHCQSYKNIIGDVRFIRVMPNTPSLVGLGVAGLYSGTSDSYSLEILAQDKLIATNIFEAVGKAIWLEQESQIDDIAAVSGSGPAYFFLFMESLKDKAIQLGFSEQDAQAMVLQTAYGSAQMAQDTGESFEQLRINVTSPGGSTAEALRVFGEQNLKNTVSEALDAAVHRAQEMSKL